MGEVTFRNRTSLVLFTELVRITAFHSHADMYTHILSLSLIRTQSVHLGYTHDAVSHHPVFLSPRVKEEPMRHAVVENNE
jgi:hypothetical protein